MVFTLTPSTAPPRREYVLLISGTMNPPHCGHIRLGLHAAQALAAAGHTVASICFVPVHDNYLLNKLALTAQQKAAAGSAPAPPSLCWPLAQRCEMLRALLREEDAPEAAVCEVLDYELTHGGALLDFLRPRVPRDSERLQLIGVGVGAVTPKDVLIARTCRDDAGVPCAVYALGVEHAPEVMPEAARDAARHRVAVRTHRVFHDLLVELLEEAGLPAPARELARMHNDKTVEPPDELRGGGAVRDQD